MTTKQFQDKLQEIRLKNNWIIRLDFHKIWEVIVIDADTEKVLAFSGSSGMNGIISLLEKYPLDSEMWLRPNKEYTKANMW